MARAKNRLVESDRNNGRPKRLGCCGVRVHGTGRPFFSPFLDFCQELMLRCGDWSAAFARGPPPKHKWGVHMLHHLRGRTMTVPLRIFEQFTELMVRQALPDHRHRGRRQMPTRSSRRHVHAREIAILMTGAASDSICALPVWSTTDLHCVLMTIIPLSRKISRRVAIHAARVVKHRDNCLESSGRPGIIARDSFMNQLCSGPFHSSGGEPWD
jgi:hypothetical protein